MVVKLSSDYDTPLTAATVVRIILNITNPRRAENGTERKKNGVLCNARTPTVEQCPDSRNYSTSQVSHSATTHEVSCRGRATAHTSSAQNNGLHYKPSNRTRSNTTGNYLPRNLKEVQASTVPLRTSASAGPSPSYLRTTTPPLPPPPRAMSAWSVKTRRAPPRPCRHANSLVLRRRPCTIFSTLAPQPPRPPSPSLQQNFRGNLLHYNAVRSEHSALRKDNTTACSDGDPRREILYEERKSNTTKTREGNTIASAPLSGEPTDASGSGHTEK